ncbi:hypothetical protein [Nonomuraea endophytica]|uniref:hypothetical protein n=1 Tax=Nonomuraea endophytica TaxID=714136 RepID=UPI0037C9D295
MEHSPKDTQRYAAELVGCLGWVTGTVVGDSFAFVRLSEPVTVGRAETPVNGG